MNPSEWFLVGVPWDCSGTGRGERAAPEALRTAGLAGLVGRDLGDLATVIDNDRRDGPTGVRALPETIRAAGETSTALAGALTDLPGRPLVAGGDCSVLLGIFAALRTAVGPAALWFVDGHPDFMDGRISDTGETADMGLALLTGVGAEPLVTLAGPAPMVSPAEVVMLGHRTRDLDEASSTELDRVPTELRRIDADALSEDPAGAGRAAAGWLAGVGQGTWLHIDLDVLDPGSLPAVTYPQPGGPDWEQLSTALRPLARSPRLLGVSVTDFRPDLDPTGELAARIVEFLEHALP